MILLQDTIQSYTYYGSSITDWIQSVGAIIAIIGSLWAFASLFRKDKDKQNQIDSLIILAKETQRQTEQLTLQSQLMEQYNKLMTSYITVLKENVETDKQRYQQEIELKKIELQMRKNNILPIFSLEVISLPHNPSFIQLRHELVNKGQAATIYNITYSEDISTVSNLSGQRIESNTKLSFYLKSKVPLGGLYLKQLKYSYKLYFEDIDKNKYYQEFICHELTGHATLPIEVNSND